MFLAFTIASIYIRQSPQWSGSIYIYIYIWGALSISLSNFIAILRRLRSHEGMLSTRDLHPSIIQSRSREPAPISRGLEYSRV